jgi:phenylpropionate dioxygenase-like ring-hydroxylating dioxygenase large terminal subunit
VTATDDRVQVAPAQTNVPFPVTDQHYVPVERYYDRGFFELEKTKLWPRTWLMACREQEIPRPGDFMEYEIVDQSVLLVRQKDMTVKALHNACRHRGTQLAKGAGRLGGGLLVCPFHGWRWNMDGSTAFVFGKEGFPAECVAEDEVALRECLVETWGGCVWINMDRNARPLAEHLSPVADQLDAVGISNMQVKYWKEVIIDCNWKIASEAFQEGWHVPQTHPQLIMGMPMENYPLNTTEYTVFENGHSRFQNAAAGPNAAVPAEVFINSARLLWTGQDAMTIERDLRLFEGLRKKVGSDDNFAEAAGKAMLDYYEGAGIPYPEDVADQKLWWGGEIFIFPNIFFLPQWGNSLAYRFRPYGDDPEKCRAEIWSLTTYPEDEPQPRATLDGRYDKEDKEHWGLIPLQDFSNIERIQRGMHSHGMTEIRLATEWEHSISNMHMELDRRLAAD